VKSRKQIKTKGSRPHLQEEKDKLQKGKIKSESRSAQIAQQTKPAARVIP
jgi:hypothetical protein